MALTTRAATGPSAEASGLCLLHPHQVGLLAKNEFWSVHLYLFSFSRMDVYGLLL